MLRTISKTLFLLTLALPLGAAEGAALPDASGSSVPSRAEMEKAARMKFVDWLEPGAPGYNALRQGAVQAGSTYWIAPRLADGKPVPQASARELAMELIEDPKVAQGVKEDLREAFPSETKQFEDHRPQNLAEIEKLKPRIEEMEKKLDVIEETMKKNVYDRGSNPQASISLSTRYQESVSGGMLQGHQARHYATISVSLSGQFPDGNYGVQIGGRYEDTLYTGGTSYEVTSTLLGVSGGHINFGTWQFGLGERDVHAFSVLTYGGIATPATSQFFNVNGDLRTIGLAPFGVGPSSELFHLRRTASPKWYWPFSEVQGIFSPRNQFYETWNNNKLYDAALRFDFSPMSVWALSEIKPYVSWLNTYNDEAQLKAAGIAAPVTQNNRAYAAGFDIGAENGSTFLFEGASSDWQRNNLAENFTDTAFYGLVTLPLGDMTFALEGSQIGPRFITGGNAQRRSDNGQTGGYHDTMMEDNERGRLGKFSYQTNMRETLGMTNNSRRYALKTEFKGAWATLGLSYAHSEQIVPSGPWLQSHFVLNGLGYNGLGWFYRFGSDYQIMAQGLAGSPGGRLNNHYNFAKPAQGPAYADGYSMGNLFWHDLEQAAYNETQTHILLSQKGVGDGNTLPDSIKYTSSLKTSLVLDLKVVFDRDLPIDLSANNDLRDTNDQPGLVMLTDEHLLAQMITDVSLRYGVTGIIDFLATWGYETWLSQHSRFPVFFISRFYGAGLDFKLDEIMSGMKLECRTQRFEFEDMNFGGRNHTDWGWSIGTSINY